MLEYRHQLTKEKERELMLRNAQLHEAEDGVRMIEDEQNNAKPIGEGGTLTMAELKQRGEYYQALQTALVNQRLMVIEAAHAVDLAREAYQEKAIEEETLVTLKEHKLEEYKEEKHRDDRKELNNLVVQRYRFSK